MQAILMCVCLCIDSYIILWGLLPIRSLQKKCEQYWNLELKDPLEVGEGLEVTTTANKGFADYEVSDITLINVRPHLRIWIFS